MIRPFSPGFVISDDTIRSCRMAVMNATSVRKINMRTRKAPGGVNDRLASPEDARKLCEAAGSRKKEVKLFTAEEGGAEHCHVDNRQVGIDYVADWLAETL